MKPLVAIALLLAGTGAQGSRWVPVSTGPEHDPAGLYVDAGSIKGRYPVRTAWEKFLNSYREQKLSFVEMNCSHNTWRAFKTIVRAPNGSVLSSAKFPRAKSAPIERDPLQSRAREVICKVSKGQERRK